MVSCPLLLESPTKYTKSDMFNAIEHAVDQRLQLTAPYVSLYIINKAHFKGNNL
jgi:hypothetical protein